MIIRFQIKIIAFSLSLAAALLTCHLSPKLHRPLRAVNTEITELVAKRVQLRLQREYKAADEIKLLLESKFNIELVDRSYAEGGGCSFHFLEKPADEHVDDSVGIMQLARTAVLQPSQGIAAVVESSKRQLLRMRRAGSHTEFLSQKEFPLANREMNGRKFADAAFLFALAGVEDEELFALLEAGVLAELQRFGSKASCRSIGMSTPRPVCRTIHPETSFPQISSK